ncbi:MAG: hypothetical protein ACKO0V_06115, partial [bacterium]
MSEPIQTLIIFDESFLFLRPKHKISQDIGPMKVYNIFISKSPTRYQSLRVSHMSMFYPCGKLSRRALLAGMSTLPIIGATQHISASEAKSLKDPLFDKSRLGLPGPFP